ncbi:MAG: hypothetical protein CBB71_10740 [Rhodopirellula sp. TMED11]|nr:MAG: hypothetical protein CBB71_10740 [Rhodopirellula sp. TMED11]
MTPSCESRKAGGRQVGTKPEQGLMQRRHNRRVADLAKSATLLGCRKQQSLGHGFGFCCTATVKPYNPIF